MGEVRIRCLVKEVSILYGKTTRCLYTSIERRLRPASGPRDRVIAMSALPRIAELAEAVLLDRTVLRGLIVIASLEPQRTRDVKLWVMKMCNRIIMPYGYTVEEVLVVIEIPRLRRYIYMVRQLDEILIKI